MSYSPAQMAETLTHSHYADVLTIPISKSYSCGDTSDSISRNTDDGVKSKESRIRNHK